MSDSYARLLAGLDKAATPGVAVASGLCGFSVLLLFYRVSQKTCNILNRKAGRKSSSLRLPSLFPLY